MKGKSREIRLKLLAWKIERHWKRIKRCRWLIQKLMERQISYRSASLVSLNQRAEKTGYEVLGLQRKYEFLSGEAQYRQKRIACLYIPAGVKRI